MSSPHQLIQDIVNITSQNPNLCYQCGKCSAGCPLRKYMDISPNQAVRFVQLGKYDTVLNSKTIWLCAGCMTCTSRCPKNFELHKFMDAMRELAIQKGIKPKDKKVAAFHEASLGQIQRHGKMNEFGLIFDYKLKTLDLMQDVENAPKMLINGKIGLKPHNVKDKKIISKVFKKADNK
jgi:heterodisulfide reductase subunit C2